MNIAAIKHISKSNMAYAYNKNTLHIYLQTAKDDITKAYLIIDDPFDYELIAGEYQWRCQNKPLIAMIKSYQTRYLDYWFSEVKIPTKRCKYAFLLEKDNQYYFYGSHILIAVNPDADKKIIYNAFDYFNYPYIDESDLYQAPAWVDNTIWYQIFPDRFNRSRKEEHYPKWGSITAGIKNSHRFGGNINGIHEKLDYIASLGINGIYLTPIFHAYSTHKYDTIDYFKIDPEFGTNEDFRRLVNACHQKGIKVMLDGVFNHCGFYHPFFQDVIKNGKKSPYWNCFYIEDENFIDFPLDKNGEPLISGNYRPKFRTFAHTPMMPKLNTSHPIIEDYLLKVGAYWINEYHIDAWRLDVSNEVSHQFWRKFRKTVKSINPNIYIVGENWDDANSWLLGEQLDAVMNYELAYPIWKFFSNDNDLAAIDAEEFAYQINDLMVRYPKNIMPKMYNLIDSHDTKRMLTRTDNNIDLLKLAFLFLFTSSGSPSIFYGDEIGIAGEHDPDCRRCMIWDEKKQNHNLLTFFKNLIRLRKKHSDFRLVDIKWLYHNDNILIYQKGKIIFIINKNNVIKTINLNRSLLNLETSEIETINNYQIEPYGYRIYIIV